MPFNQVSRLGQEPRVYVGFARQYAPHLRCVEIEQSMGGKRLDHAVLEVDFGLLNRAGGAPGRELTDRSILANFDGREIRITVQSRTGGEQLIHWGTISQDRLRLDERVAEHLVSTTEPHHFGWPIRGQYVVSRLNRISQGDFWGIPPTQLDPNVWPIEEPPIFNPMIDGRLRPNMSTRLSRVDGTSLRVFIDPAQSESEPAANYATSGGQFPERWTLAWAVAYLAWTLNPDQRHVFNPSFAEMNALLVRDGQPIYLENARLASGWYLPQCLDALLNPYGFSWSVRYFENPIITLHELGRGPTKTIYMQNPGEAVDQRRTPPKGFHLHADNTRRRSNHFIVRGSKQLLEVTVELVPAWDWDGALDWKRLNLEDDMVALDPAANLRVGRDWVLNEGGDYIGNHVPKTVGDGETEIVTLEEPFRWTPYDFAPRRRKFLPCVSRERSDGAPAFSDYHGVLIEWSDNAGTDWWWAFGKPWESTIQYAIASEEGEMSFELLEKECGIRWTGGFPPHNLIDAGEDARLRITAAIETDQLITAVYPADWRKALPERMTLQVDVPDRFHWRVVDLNATTRDLLPDDDADENSPLISGAADDRQALNIFAKNLHDAWNAADIGGEIPLEGVDWSLWGIGDCITSIHGRGILLQSNTISPPKYPQVVGLRYDIEKQTTHLTLDTWRDEVR